jgi:prepilin-type N-terminal cleavage/methylation domain-containing protein
VRTRVPRTKFHTSHRRAFTLIELLVAAGITALLAGFIAVIVRNISTVSTRASNRLGTDAQARIVLDQLQLDLQGALFRDDGNVWFAADVLDRTNNSGLWDTMNANTQRLKPAGGMSLQMTASNLADARFGQAGVWLRFFTHRRGTNTSTTNASAPVAVGYQIIRRPVATNTANTNIARAYLLHRAEVRPAATAGTNPRPGVLETGYTITAGPYSTVSSSTNSGAITGDPRSIQAPGSNTESPRNLDSVIGDNVIDFGVRCYVRDPTVPGGLRLIFPANTTGGLSNANTTRLRGTLPPATPTMEWGDAQPFPEVVDVMVRVLTDEGAALIANIERNQTPALPVPQKYNNNVQQWWWGVAIENSRVYTRRIVLNAKPL